MIIRKTADRLGRYDYATSENSNLQFLNSGWIRLTADHPSAEMESGSREHSLIVTRGSALAEIDSETHQLEQYDALFVPPGCVLTITTQSAVDIATASAPSSIQSSPKLIRYADALNDPSLTLEAGADQYRRKVVKLIDQNVDAERLLCGLTFGAPGNWTSWSPHEHASTREEVYLYIDMPEPAFGIQMIYTDLETDPFLATVFEDDAAVITEGYHPNAGIPGFGINFVWMMAGLRPNVDREWAEMHWQEAFAGRYE